MIKTIFTCEHNREGCPYCAEAVHDLRLKLANTLTNNNQWRRVEDGLPPHDGDYLCTVQLPQECGNVWIRQEVVWCSMNKFPEKVIAWMPLPEPYKGENE